MDERGQQIGPYRLEERLGEGGQSVVWKATDLRSGGLVALKKLRDARAEMQNVARLRREAALLRSFSDPGLPRGIELIETPAGEFILVMEFIDGRPLHHAAGLDPREASSVFPMFCELSRLVALLHAQGVAHRDIKQPNILVRPGWERGAAGSVVLVDLGIARGSQLFATTYTATGGVVGTFAFMAPELLAGHREPSPGQYIAGDVFSLGVVLWSSLTGMHPAGLPLQAPVMQLLALHARGVTFQPTRQQIEAVERSVPGLSRVIERCLAVNPADRFPHAGALYQALLGLERGVVPASPGSPRASTLAPDLPTSALLGAATAAPSSLLPAVPSLVLPPAAPAAARAAPAHLDTAAAPALPADPSLPWRPPADPSPPWRPPADTSPWRPPADSSPPWRPPVDPSPPWRPPAEGAALAPAPPLATAPPVVVPAPPARARRRPLWGYGLVLLALVAAGSWVAWHYFEWVHGRVSPALALPPAAAPPAAKPAPVEQTATVTPPPSNNHGIVRAGPGLDFAEIEQIPRGGRVTLLELDAGGVWYRVVTPRTQRQGYMHRDVLRLP